MLNISKKSPVWLPVIVVLIAMLSIQSGASLAKSLFSLLGAPGVMALRIALGTLILVIIFKPWRLRFKKKQFLLLLCYGLALGAMNYFFYLSIQTIPLGIAVSLEFTGPLIISLFSSRKLMDLLWVALIIFGLRFLLPIERDIPINLTKGSFLALCAGACWAIYILTGQRIGKEYGPAIVSLGSVIAAIVFVPIGVVQTTESIWKWSILPIGLVVAILSTVLPYSLEMIALTHLPSRIFGTLMSIEPALATLFGMMFLGERLTIIQIIGLCSIIIASIGSMFSSHIH